MEIDITDLFNNIVPSEFSASKAELGENAANITWNNAIEQAERMPLLSTYRELDTFKSYMKEFGAWDKDEIAAYNKDECNALLIQLITGDMREAGFDQGITWEEYEIRAEKGTCPGNITRSGDRIYYEILA